MEEGLEKSISWTCQLTSSPLVTRLHAGLGARDRLLFAVSRLDFAKSIAHVIVSRAGHP
jgi:hypothetical protein